MAGARARVGGVEELVDLPGNDGHVAVAGEGLRAVGQEGRGSPPEPLCLRNTATSFLSRWAVSQRRTVRSAPAESANRPPSFTATDAHRSGVAGQHERGLGLAELPDANGAVVLSGQYQFPFGLTPRLAAGVGDWPCERIVLPVARSSRWTNRLAATRT